MKTARLWVIACSLPFLVAALVPAQEPVHWDVVDRILDEAFENSEVMENAFWLTDVFGPRNSKSSGYREASVWARQQLEDYGLSNARLEPFEFGRGWENMYSSFHMVEPQYMPIIGYPAAWSAGTAGKIRLQAVYVNLDDIESAADLDPYREEIPGKVVLIEPLRDLSDQYAPTTTPYTEAELDEMARTPVGPTEPRSRRRRDAGLSLEERIDLVFAAGATAVARTDGTHAYGTVDGAVNGYALTRRMWDVNAAAPITEWILAAEHYNRMVRLLQHGIAVEMEAEVVVDFPGDDSIDFNVIAEIPGTDLADEIVLVGAHLQSEPIGTGATDDAAGVVIAMEVVRIFQALGIRPRRTVRIGLFGGHEMGLFGNNSHVAMHYADPENREYKPDYDKLSAYFNVDNGAGRIVGISVLGSEEIRGIFSAWIKPLHGLGMRHLFSTGMAHESYEEVGLNGFYFRQDRRDDRRYHSNMDVYDRLIPEDLMANSVILATFVYHAAMRNEMMPRALPRPW